MSGLSRFLAPLAALLALAYLAGMVWHGAQPVQRQLVRFEARGVLRLPPEGIRRVEIARGDERLTLVRTGEKSWATDDGRTVAGEAGARLSMAVQMMHTSAPVNEIGAAELLGADMAPFGLVTPRLTATLYADRPEPLLVAHFGGRNPEDFLQYMRLDGDSRLFLMSRFVGEEWNAAFDGAQAP